MKKLISFVALILLVAADQIAKVLTVMYLKDGKPKVIIDGVFELTYVENRGAAFGMFQGGIPVFTVITLVLLVIVTYFFFKLPDTKRMIPLRIICILIAAGGIGNLIDRIFRGFVVDTFSFVLINFPVFNVADCYVTVAEFAFIFLFLFYYKDSEFEGVLPRLKKNKAVGEATVDTASKKGEDIGE